MAKSIKTPSLSDVEYSATNTELALKTYVAVVNGVQYVVEAESQTEAEEKIQVELQVPEIDINEEN